MKRRNGDGGSNVQTNWLWPSGPVSLAATAAWAAALLLLGACGSSDETGIADRPNWTSPTCVNEGLTRVDGVSLGPNEFRPECVAEQECEPAQTKPCSNGWFEEAVGVCEFGTHTCDEDGYWGTCDGVVAPTDEVCDDGLDNDCDNKIDCLDPDCHDNAICCGSDCEPDCEPGKVVACNDGLFDEPVGLCSEGVRVCTEDEAWGPCEGAVGPDVEECDDAIDNDCDGKTDCDDPDCAEFLACNPVCDPGMTEPCNGGLFAVARGLCSKGVRVCDEDGQWSLCEGAVGPDVEECDDAIDNDCDGKTDCDDPDCSEFPDCNWDCTPGQTEACEGNLMGVCNPGTRVCLADGTWSGCQGAVKPSREICNDGLDNDCDKNVDCKDPDCANTATCKPKPVCTKITEVREPWKRLPDCNDHKGDNLKACLAAGNPRGCFPDALEAWCTRRINNSWKDMKRAWVASQCNGTVKETTVRKGTKDYPVYYCDDWSKCVRFRAETPLVLVFDMDDPVRYHADDGAKGFDLSSAQDGSATRTDWPTAATPWLALDRDGDGQINSGRELFGSATLVGGSAATHGFEALAQLDADGNGIVDAKDPGFGRLVLWYDHNADRQSQGGEMRTMADVGIVSLHLRYRRDARCDDRGNCGVERAVFHWRDKQGKLRKGAIVDVHLAVRR